MLSRAACARWESARWSLHRWRWVCRRSRRGGLPGYESAATACVFAPAAVPEALVNRVSDEVRKVMARADVRDRLLKQSVEPVGMTPAETAAYIKADTVATAKLVRDAGIRQER